MNYIICLVSLLFAGGMVVGKGWGPGPTRSAVRAMQKKHTAGLRRPELGSDAVMPSL